MAKFSCIREAVSFVDSGNAPFIGLLFLIGELKQANASGLMQVMNRVLLGRYIGSFGYDAIYIHGPTIYTRCFSRTKFSRLHHGAMTWV